MPTQVYWDNPDKTIIVREMTDDWTWEDYGKAIGEVHQMLSEVDHVVDITVDCRGTYKLPQGALQKLANSNRRYPQNIGQQVIVATSYFLEIFAKMVQQYMPHMRHLFTYVNTVDEAYQHIDESRTQTSG